MNNQKKQPMEFSKKLLYMIFSVTGIIILFTLAIVWKTGDQTSMVYLIPAIFIEVATATGFYFNKAKHENIIKLESQYGTRIKEEDELNEFNN